MATSTVESLFGITPEALQAQRDESLRTQALQYAQLDPMQQAQMTLYMGGNRLGGAIGGLLGAKDPELERIRSRQQLIQGTDINDPVALRAKASAALNAGDVSAATILSNRAADLEQTALKARQTNAEITAKLSEKLSPEQKNAAALADTVADRGTPEWTAEYNKQLTRLTTDKTTQPQWDIKEVGVAEGTREPVYTLREPGKAPTQIVYRKDANGNQVAVPYFGGVDRTTAKVSATATSKGETAFAERLGGKDADRVDAAITARENAIGAINSLNTLAGLDDNGLISGTFATGRVGATNLLNTLGLASPTDAAKLASSENYQKVAGDVILKTLGGKLGAGFSNEDRAFIQSLVPQLENSPAARRQLINYMVRKNQDIITESLRLEDYARKNKGLGGFVPKITLGTAAATSPLSTEELAKRAGGKIVNGRFVKD